MCGTIFVTDRSMAMYKIDVHIQGIAQGTEWFRTITKLDKVRYPDLHRAVTLVSLSMAEKATSGE